MAVIVSFNGNNYSIPSTGDVGWGDQVSAFLVAVANAAIVSGGTVPVLTITSETVNSLTFQASVLTVAGGDTITPAATNISLSALSPVSLSATTAISDGTAAGQLLILMGNSDINTISIQHGANTSMNGDVILGAGDTITFKWDSTLKWVEVERSL